MIQAHPNGTMAVIASYVATIAAYGVSVLYARYHWHPPPSEVSVAFGGLIVAAVLFAGRKLSKPPSKPVAVPPPPPVP